MAGRYGLEPGRLHRLGDDGVEGLLERTAPSLTLRVANHLQPDGPDLSVTFGFRHRRDFTAAAVARAISELSAEFGAGGSSATKAAAPEPAPEPARSAPEASGDDAIDRLLDMVATPAGPTQGASRKPPIRPGSR